MTETSQSRVSLGRETQAISRQGGNHAEISGEGAVQKPLGKMFLACLGRTEGRGDRPDQTVWGLVGTGRTLPFNLSEVEPQRVL